MNDGSFAARFSPRSFRIKVTLWLVLAMLILTGLSGILLERVAIDGQFNQLRERLMVIAQISALSIDVKTIQKIPLTRNGVNTRSYKQIKGQLQQILKASPSLNDIYILTKTNQDGIWQFVVDMETSTTGKGRPAAAYPGYQYNVALFPAMMKGFDGPSADSSLEEDEWGVSLSGYAPIRNKTGEALAVLGVDMSADDIRKTIAELNRRLWFILAAGLIVSLVFGLWISRKISDPVKKLAEGTRRIAAGDMQYRVNIETLDEIGELARSFNSMADSLADAQKNLNEYFIRIVQSFVLSLEAKDP
jgi:adenylate cyclase